MELGAKLKIARKSAGLTQKQIASLLGVTESAYCGYETGKRQPDALKIKQIAKILNVTGDYLLDIETDGETLQASTTKSKKLPVQNGQAVSREAVAQALRSVDLLDKDGKLSDEDLAFLLSVGEIIRQWFANREHMDDSL